jgi:hypothetical protein
MGPAYRGKMRIQKDLENRWRMALLKKLGRDNGVTGQILLENFCAQAARDGLSSDGTRVIAQRAHMTSMAALHTLLHALERAQKTGL